MNATVLEREALLLPATQRALLADRLLQSLGTGDRSVMEAWAAEAETRLDAWQRGEMAAGDGPEAVARIRKML